MRRATTMVWGLFGVAVAVSGLLVGACKGDATSDGPRICTPKNYVFCRCADRNEGTKLCTDGTAFDACQCGSAADPGPLNPDGNSAFQPVEVDAGAPAPGAPVIDARCAGKLAVLGSSDTDINLFAAAYAGNGTWKVGKAQGPALRGTPHAALVGGELIAAWRTRYDLIAWTKFQVGQITLTPPVSIGSASTAADPALAALAASTSAKVFYLGANDTHFEGTYTAAAGWNAATSAIPSPTTDGGVAVAGKSAPVAAALGGSHVIAFTGADTKVVRQTLAGSTWGAPLAIPNAAAFPQPPALVAMDGGTKDLLLVYVGADLLLHSTTREASNKVWNTAIVVDTAASPSAPPELAPMTGGRAMLLFKGANEQAYVSVYDPTKVKPWSVPAELVPGKNPVVVNTPSVNQGRCGGDATVAYAERDRGVGVMRYETNGTWTGPFEVPGLLSITFVGAGEVP